MITCADPEGFPFGRVEVEFRDAGWAKALGQGKARPGAEINHGETQRPAYQAPRNDSRRSTAASGAPSQCKA